MRIQKKHLGLTIIELTVVILILSILSTISIGVYTGYLERARFSATRATIEELELAITRYESDLGAFPISGRYTDGTTAPFTAPYLPASNFFLTDTGGGINGCGNLILCLQHSTSGDSTNPSDPRWFGPYISPQFDDLGDGNGDPITADTHPADTNLLDPWGNPYRYVRSVAYTTATATEQKDSPFYTNETHYNPLTYQIFSLGPDGLTESDPTSYGLGADDVNNFDQR
jgi:type II secretory pathway pseudopilin PulG